MARRKLHAAAASDVRRCICCWYRVGDGRSPRQRENHCQVDAARSSTVSRDGVSSCGGVVVLRHSDSKPVADSDDRVCLSLDGEYCDYVNAGFEADSRLGRMDAQASW